MKPRELQIKFWGDWACFTRPEFKAERVSYEFPTPSAMVGAFSSVYWKNEFIWVLRSIALLNPIKQMSVMRNEIKSKQSDNSAKEWAKNGVGGYYAAADRTQRHSLILKDVAYLATACIEPKPHADKSIRAYEEQFLRRVRKGQCFQRPYLGCREFAANFAPPDGSEQPIDVDKKLGFMLRGLDYIPDENGSTSFCTKDEKGRRIVKGRVVANFFQAELKGGILNCSY